MASRLLTYAQATPGVLVPGKYRPSKRSKRRSDGAAEHSALDRRRVSVGCVQGRARAREAGCGAESQFEVSFQTGAWTACTAAPGP